MDKKQELREFISDKTVDSQKEMEDWFTERTNKHINYVQEFCKKLYKADPYFIKLLKRAEEHDQSKFLEPERTPYIALTWRYKMKSLGKDYPMSPEAEEAVKQATLHHITTNRHHPEYGQSPSDDLLNSRDRDAIPDKMVDATGMEPVDIGEMVCDWAAMGKEKGGTPKEWADKVVNKRWKFTDGQVRLIYSLIDKIW